MPNVGESIVSQRPSDPPMLQLDQPMIRAYLARIDIVDIEECSLNHDLLARLHERHLLAVPFENIDPYIGVPLSFDVGSLVEKIVHRRRGGVCYELNMMFAGLLAGLGFNTRFLVGDMHSIGTRHTLLLVEIDGEQYLADVGYGCYFVRPLRLDPGEEQEDPNGRYRIVDHGSVMAIQRRVKGMWLEIVEFTLDRRSPSDIIALWENYQSRPDAEFLRRLFIQRRTESGWAMLREDSLTCYVHGEKRRQTIDRRRLAELAGPCFGIDAANLPVEIIRRDADRSDSSASSIR